MPLYIKASANISPQPTWGKSFDHAISYTDNRLTCIEPDYIPWIAPAQQRRMSRIIKMGVAAALMALKEAGLSHPDGIITGTGLGCLQDTGQFLAQTIENQEVALNPTPFIQSTHNTIGSQIALLLQAQGYNQTYAQDGSSFESALIDANLQLLDLPDQNLLVGGIDEITDYSHAIHNRFRLYKKNSGDSLALLSSGATGTLQGEGSAWFVLTGLPQTQTARIDSVVTLYNPKGDQKERALDEMLEQAGMKWSAVDLLISGNSGDIRFDAGLDEVSRFFRSSSTAVFKHLCGEYPVASAFALWLAADIAKTKRIPEIVLRNDKGRTPEKILIHNQYFGRYHSFILLTAC